MDKENFLDWFASVCFSEAKQTLKNHATTKTRSS
jgi:hypothetical protein